MTVRTRPSLLRLDSSADHPGESVSRRLTTLFADLWGERHGTAGYRHRDLAAEPVPPISSAYCVLGRRAEIKGVVPASEVHALVENAQEEREWALTLPLITEVLAADTVLLGVPMYNFSVPASLKAWIDRVSFPGAFPEGSLRETRVVVVIARGGAYGPGTPREAFDFQEPYLRAYFGDLGVAEEHLHLVRAEMTLADRVPGLARFQGIADETLAEATATLTALATGR
ncbi:FMN-dependent NADH-azoreductase [Streptosporangium algeriense]|uniref:FMN dependent NADH:quinone oxidoreductase n=1 Tax=Streptosporangium algeriense TaxID=1682748 RepID=A0ABW3DWS5_9ACTN